VNICKKIILSLGLIGIFCPLVQAALPCGTSSAGVLNVGILPGNLPYSAIVSGQAVGFDPLLVMQVAKSLGFSKVNFIGFPNAIAAEAALLAGTIDIYANSATILTVPPTTFIGIVTDISRLYSPGAIVTGWLLGPSCCALAEQIDAAITQLVNTGVYAQILQSIRLNGQTNGFTLGVPTPGILLEPFPFASSEIGTIPALCAPAGPNFTVTLPQTNCIAAFLQANCAPTTTFTGATGQIPPG
jgi:hypothetical protein